jgi:hypothetical protein
MFTRRKFLAASVSSFALTLGVARRARANVGAWAQAQGGSQDLQTGLVWLDYSLLEATDVTYPYAISESAIFVDPTYGYNDWRVPTLAEMLAACDHGIDLYCPLENGPGPDGDLWWSSTTKATKGGKGAYAVDLTTGASQVVLVSSKLGQQVYYSALFGMFVRQGTL